VEATAAWLDSAREPDGAAGEVPAPSDMRKMGRKTRVARNCGRARKPRAIFRNAGETPRTPACATRH